MKSFSISIKDDKTLLARFIKDKSKAYVEPERKGTAKGDKIGFSCKKYNTLLLKMRAYLLKDIAKEFNMSYSTIRIWDIQEDYKAEFEKLCKEFSEIFINFLRDKYKKEKSVQDTLYKNDLPIIKKFTQQNSHYYYYKELEDIPLYNPSLVEIIENKLLETMEDERDNFIFLAVFRKILLLKRPYEERILCDQSHYSMVALNIIDHAISLINSPDENKEKKIYHALLMIKGYFDSNLKYLEEKMIALEKHSK